MDVLAVGKSIPFPGGIIGFSVDGPEEFDLGFVFVIGDIGGTAGLTVSGGGTLILSSIDNSYIGPTTIAAGTTVSLAASEVIPDTSAVSIAAAALLNTSTFNETVGSISGAGTITVGSGKTLAAGGDDSSTPFTGVIQGAGGSIAKNGLGTLSLTNTNTFGGAGSSVAVNAGTLAISSDSSLGNSANAVTLVDGATLAVDTSGGAFSNSRAINLSARSAGSFATISVSGGNGAILNGKVGGSSGQVAGLIKTGNGSLTLGSATNNFLGLNIAGSWDIQSGILQIGPVIPNTRRLLQHQSRRRRRQRHERGENCRGSGRVASAQWNRCSF